LTSATTATAQSVSMPSITMDGPTVALSPLTRSVNFKGAKGDRISLLTEPSGASTAQCVNVGIQAFDRTPLYANQACGGIDFSDVLTLPATGTYTISVGAGSGAKLSLYSVPPDATGALAVEGAAEAISIIAPGQNASLIFMGEANDQVSLLTQPDSSLARNCYTVRVLAPDGKTSVYGRRQCGPLDLSGTVVLPVAGRYTVLLDPVGSATGTASLTLFRAPVDEDAPLGVRASRFVAAISSPGKVARFGFNGLVGNRISLLTEADSALRKQCLDVSILTPDGKAQVYRHSQCGTPDFSSALTLPVSGTYALVVSSTGADIGTSRLTLFDIPPDAKGNVMIGGSSAPLAVAVPGQKMRMGFVASANQTANISVTADAAFSSQCYSVSVLGPDGSALRTDEGCDTAYSSGVLRLPATGTYTIVISSTGLAIGAASIGVTAQ
jgi:hypothetical protein